MVEREIGTADRPRHYEADEVRPRLLALFGIIAFAAIVLSLLALYWIFGVFERDAREADRVRVASAVPSAAPVPPEPRLQGVPGFHANTPSEDLAELKRKWQELLGSYGRTAEEGFVRIPVERAMDLLLERGLPEERK